MADLFKIIWGSEGTGTTEYTVTGTLNFNATYIPETNINNLSELELGIYTVKCKIKSPSKKELTKEKKVVIATLDNTSIDDVIEGKIEAYAIYSEYDLAYFRDLVNDKNEIAINGRVMNNLDLSHVSGINRNWIPIGNVKYNGVFYGENNIIDKLYINVANDNQGLFGNIENATIVGVIIGENSIITGNNCVGGIAGNATNCSIRECGNNGKVTIKGKNMAGGILGQNINTHISKSYNKGEIKAEGSQYCVGGICGFVKENSSKTEIIYSYNTGSVTGWYYIGGITGAGNDNCEISNCYNKGTITANGFDDYKLTNLGGIVGRLAGGEAYYCFNLGKVDNRNIGSRVGGIVGSNTYRTNRSAIIEYCYNSGNIESKGAGVGGIGNIEKNAAYIKNSYVADSATIKYNGTLASVNIGTATPYLGKVIGFNNAGSAYISNLGVLTNMTTVYKVVNGLNDGTSSYWSKSNINQPSLLWEER